MNLNSGTEPSSHTPLFLFYQSDFPFLIYGLVSSEYAAVHSGAPMGYKFSLRHEIIFGLNELH